MEGFTGWRWGGADTVPRPPFLSSLVQRVIMMGSVPWVLAAGSGAGHRGTLIPRFLHMEPESGPCYHPI